MYAEPAAWHRLCDRFAASWPTTCRAGRGRRAGDPDLRFLGRRSSAAPTTASSPCRTPGGSSTRSRRPACRRSTSASARARSCRHGRGRRRRHRRRLAAAARRCMGHDRSRSRHPGQPRSVLLLGPAGSVARRRRRRAAPRRAAAPVTSSISATASCRRRRSNTSSGSPRTCTKHRAHESRLRLMLSHGPEPSTSHQP